MLILRAIITNNNGTTIETVAEREGFETEHNHFNNLPRQR